MHLSTLSSAVLIACLVGGLTTVEATAQTAGSEDVNASNQVEAQGTVISTTPNTLIIRTDDGRYYLFVLDEETTRPSKIPVQSQVTVTFVPTDDDDQAPAADFVKVTETAPAQPAQAAPAPTDEPVPASIREMEETVRRQARRYRLGVRAGATLDPELIMVGVHSQLGPFFSDRLWARPNAEFAFGEITDLVALNVEGLYQLPIMPRRSRWSVYLGGGPGLNFSRRAFSDEEDGEEVDFDDFDLDVGLNMFVGIQSVSGMFMEVKASAWATPSVRFQVGYNF